MRQLKDPYYGQLLHDLRSNDIKKIQQHFEMLRKRLIGSSKADVDARIKDFSGVPIFVTSNTVRCALNFDMTKKFAQKANVRQIVVVAHDHIKDKTIWTETRLFLLNQLDSDTGNIPGYVPLVIDMPLTVKNNNAAVDVKLIDFGVCNGCVLKRIHLDEREPPVDVTVLGRPQFLHYQPKCLIVYIQPDKYGKHKFVQLPGLEVGEFPICPCTTPFVLKKQKADGGKPTINRLQFPDVPEFSFTGYNVQGTTVERACVDLAIPTGKGGGLNAEDAHVLLGRITSLSGLYILRDFSIDALLKPRGADLLAEIEWLETLNAETLKPFNINLTPRKRKSSR